jgi:hypothetical protein
MTARVHEVKKSRVAYPGIPLGSHYYWWKFAYREAIRSLTRPKPSQLTQSAFISEALSIQEDMDELGTGDIRDGISLSDYADRIRELGEQASDSLGNMPDALQQSPTGELLQNRADNCEQWASDLESVDMDIDEDGIRADAEEEAKQDERWENADGADNNELIDEIIDSKTDERAEEILEEISSANSSVDIE